MNDFLEQFSQAFLRPPRGDSTRGGPAPHSRWEWPITHYCTRNRKGNFKVGRKTEKSRLRRVLAALGELMRAIRHWSLKDQVCRLNQSLRGHYAYYGLAGNLRSLRKVYRFVERYWLKMLSKWRRFS